MPIYEILCEAYDYLRGVKSELLDDINEGYYDEDEMVEVNEELELLKKFITYMGKKCDEEYMRKNEWLNN